MKKEEPLSELALFIFSLLIGILFFILKYLFKIQNKHITNFLLIIILISIFLAIIIALNKKWHPKNKIGKFINKSIKWINELIADFFRNLLDYLSDFIAMS